MGHALPDCIGITRVGEDISEYAYLDDHRDGLVGASAPNGWQTSRWLDASGAMFVLSKHNEGYYNGSAHFNGTTTTKIGDLAWIEDTVYLTASVLDAEGEVATRLCAGFGQFPYFGELDHGGTYDAVITGLARDVTVYPTVEAFKGSRDCDKGPLDNPVELPDGTTIDRLEFAVGSFTSTGLLSGGSPMARFSGEVVESFAYTVEGTGATVHVASVTAVGCLTIYVCWPEYLAPVPEVGNVVQVGAYLTAFMPELWRQQVVE